MASRLTIRSGAANTAAPTARLPLCVLLLGAAERISKEVVDALRSRTGLANGVFRLHATLRSAVEHLDEGVAVDVLVELAVGSVAALQGVGFNFDPEEGVVAYLRIVADGATVPMEATSGSAVTSEVSGALSAGGGKPKKTRSTNRLSKHASRPRGASAASGASANPYAWLRARARKCVPGVCARVCTYVCMHAHARKFVHSVCAGACTRVCVCVLARMSQC